MALSTPTPVDDPKLLVPEATVEHAGVKDLIEQLQDVAPDGETDDAKVKVLSEYVKHHVKEGQREMFPKAKASSFETDSAGWFGSEQVRVCEYFDVVEADENALVVELEGTQMTVTEIGRASCRERVYHPV